MEKEKQYRIYDPDYHPQMAYKLSLLFGANNRKLAEFFEVPIQTIEYWMRDRPEFCDAVHRGRDIADSEVAVALYKSAVGYDYEEEVVHTYRGRPVVTRVKRHRPINPWSAVKILSLRHRDAWSISNPPATQNVINFNKVNVLSGLTTEQLKLLADIGLKQLQGDPEQELNN